MNKNNSKKSESALFFEEVEHTADAAMRIRGRDWEQLLENAAAAMASLMLDTDDASENFAVRRLEVHADDVEGLLVEWLSELAFLAETESLVFRSCEFLETGPKFIKADVRTVEAIKLKAHVKAVTYHYLEIVETRNGLEATVVFDL